MPARYSCREGSLGPGIASCTGTVANGARLATSTPGRRTLTVSAISRDGQRASASVAYGILPRIQVRITRLLATPLDPGCVVETGSDEREIIGSAPTSPAEACASISLATASTQRRVRLEVERAGLNP